MREFINIVENASVPRVLYHGTTVEHLIGIFMDGAIIHRPGIDDFHDGVSLTSDLETAWVFADDETHESSVLYMEVLHRDNNFKGAVMVFDTASVSPVTFAQGDEFEWRAHGNIPVSAMNKLLGYREEFEQYQRDLHQARKLIYDDKSYVAFAGKEDFYKWLNNPLRDAAIERILSLL